MLKLFTDISADKMDEFFELQKQLNVECQPQLTETAASQTDPRPLFVPQQDLVDKTPVNNALLTHIDIKQSAKQVLKYVEP